MSDILYRYKLFSYERLNYLETEGTINQLTLTSGSRLAHLDINPMHTDIVIEYVRGSAADVEDTKRSRMIRGKFSEKI